MTARVALTEKDRLRLRIRDLEAQLEDARAALADDGDRRFYRLSRLQTLLGLSPTEAALLHALESGRVTPRDVIMDRLYFDRPEEVVPKPKIIDVLICRLRRKLARFGVVILTVYRRGLMLPPESRAALRTVAGQW
jgi:DNA-binding response OmpR family regulator